MCYECVDREVVGGGLLLVELWLDGVGGMFGRDGGDGIRFGCRKGVGYWVYFKLFCMYFCVLVFLVELDLLKMGNSNLRLRFYIF